ncbi:MAG: hypothetical protein ACLVEJ_07025 [Parabacteroides sp.]
MIHEPRGGKNSGFVSGKTDLPSLPEKTWSPARPDRRKQQSWGERL